ncbi:hypothetical protein ACFE04_002122 [Oxalis oulophora]
MAAANTAANTIVPQVLGYDNYAIWSACLKNYLLAQDLWDIVENPPNADHGDSPNAEEYYKVWRRKNAAALHAIQVSCGPEMLFVATQTSSANTAWITIAQVHQIANNYQQSPETNHNEDDDVVDQDNNNQQPPETNCAGSVKSPSLPQANNSGYVPTISRLSSVGTHGTEFVQYQPLVQAINTGDLEAVMDFITRKPDSKTAILNSSGYRPLHLVLDGGRQVKIAEKLIQLLTPEELELQDSEGFTALGYAAIQANFRMAKCIINAVNNNKNILGIANNRGDIPVLSASYTGHKKLTRYLYSLTPHELLDGTTGSTLICSLITIKIYDVALDLIRKYPHLATVPSNFVTVPLVTLSKLSSIFPSGSRLSFWRQLVFPYIHVQLPATSNQFCIDVHQNEESDKGNISKLKQGIAELYEMKLNQLYAVEILHCMCQELPPSSEIDIASAFFHAIIHGTVELVVELCKSDRELLFIRSAEYYGRAIFSLAVQFRQEKMFSLIYGLPFKDSLNIDLLKNNILHVAGFMAPANQLANISGAALQMQRELQWFKEVERVAHPLYKVGLNNNSDRAHEVFTKEHKELKKQGEEWMKDSATSCSIVGALIITVMFTAVFTIPGGNDQNTGYPMFLQRATLKVFVVADVISLFSSTTSVLMFLGILTSRYAEKDFLKSLPTKLMIGLSTLFISIAAMMVAFCAALILMLKGQLNIIVPTVVLASFPVAAFVWLQFPILIEIFMSTYGPSIFNRKMKPWL